MTDSEEKPSTLAEAMRRKLTGEFEQDDDQKELEDVPQDPQANYRTLMVLARKISQELNKQINLKARQEPITEEFHKTIMSSINQIVDAVEMPLSVQERSMLLNGVKDEIFGFGPLGPLLRDPTMEVICVNTYNQVFKKTHARFQHSHIQFEDEQHLLDTIEKIYLPHGLQLNEKTPVLSATLPNGSKVEAAIPPASKFGSTLTIDLSTVQLKMLRQFVDEGMISLPMAGLLRSYVENKINVIFCGAGSSDTNGIINALSMHIGQEERIVSIEEDFELRIAKENWVPLAVGVRDTAAGDSLSMKELIESALKMHADRIILRDCQGQGVFEILNAWSLGSITGLMSTRARSPMDCLKRLQVSIRRSEPNLPQDYELDLIGKSLQVIVQTKRLEDGKICISEIAEVRVSEKNELTVLPVYSLDSQSSENGALKWGNPLKDSMFIKNPRHPESVDEVDLKDPLPDNDQVQ